MMSSRFIISALLALNVCVAPLFAQATKQQQTLRERLEREIAILDKQIKDNASKSASALTRLSLVQSRVAARQALVNESDKQIAAISAEISSKQREISILQAQIDTMTIYYKKLVRSAYKNRDSRVWYMYILASGNLSQGIRRYSYLRDLSKEMNAKALKIKQSKEEVESQKALLLEMQKNAEELRSQRVAELRQIQSEEKDAKTLTSQLQKEKNRYQKELNSKKKEAEALERSIKNAITSTTNGKSSKQVDYKLAGEFASNKGKLPWPVDGSIVSHFGKQYHSVFKNLTLPPNNGITIAVSPDAEVSAVYDGTVAQISILPGYNQCILIQHGNYFTLYSKVKKVYVKKGDKVKTGGKLGTVDTINGETTFHFEIWNEKTTPQNPETWLRVR